MADRDALLAAFMMSQLAKPPVPVPIIPVVTDTFTAIERGDILTGEIQAWRYWRLFDGRLHSMITAKQWVPGEAMEGDVDGMITHPPEAGPSIPLGVYAWRLPVPPRPFHPFEDARAAWVSRWAPGVIVVGTVDLYGEVVTYTKGYRAQYAQITSLDAVNEVGPISDKRLDDLRRQYGVSSR